MIETQSWQEAAERCMSVMISYHDAQRSPEADGWMASELRAIGSWIEEEGDPLREAARRIIEPVEDGLMKRFGDEVGPRLTSIFVRTFGTTTPRSRGAFAIGIIPGPPVDQTASTTT